MTFYFYVFLIVTIVFLQLSASFDHRPLHSVSRVRNFQIGSSRTRHVQPVQDDQRCSQQPRLGIQKLASNIIGKGLLSASLLFSLSGVPVFAVGELFEFKDRPMILQDISFNVDDAAKEQQMVDALFQQKIRLIRDQSSSTDNKLVVGYGADYYKSPESFHPGVSDFQEDGGHATLTFRSKKASASSDVSELIDRGDGLLYVKMGTETIRLSKAIQQGADIQFAYGYVDLQSPGQVPYEVVVGLTRDPVMLAALRVSDVAASAKFFTDTLGMQQSNMPLARTAGSLYERQQPADSVYLSYGPDSMGVLLLPPATLSPAEVAAQADLQESSGSPFLKFLPGGGGGGGGVGSSKRGSAAARRINVGNLLDAFTIVVDDGNPQQLPPAVRDALEKAAAAAGGDGTAVIQSPDGYPFRLKPYSIFTKEATKSVPVP